MKVLTFALLLSVLGGVLWPRRGWGRAEKKVVTFYVSPDGNDTWSGRLPRPNADRTDGPLASLQGARDAIRSLKQEGERHGVRPEGERHGVRSLQYPVRVEIAEGLYTLTEPLVFTPEDSGTAECPILYEAASGATCVFEGGREIKGFQPAGDGVWTTQIPEVAAGDGYFEQLWVNGRRAVRARTPNVVRHGETPVPRYLYTGRKVGYGVDPRTGAKADLSNRAFIARPDDTAVLEQLPQDRLSDVTLVAYHSWESSRHRLAAANVPTGEIITTGPAPWPMMMWGPNQRYHLENFRAALDEPGEWFLDREGTLFYWPLPDEDMTTARVIAPVVGEFIRFAGMPEVGLPVEQIVLRGLSFRYSGYTLPPEGHGDAQAAVTIPAVILADGARNVTIEGCEVAHTSVYGLWFRRGCRDCVVRRCHFHDLGAGGVRLGETTIRPDESEHTGRITVDNNIIRAGGRLFTGAVGVWIGQSSDNQVTHNDISDFFYTGVSVGWSWGYADTVCQRNRIEFNHIHHLGWGVQSDMGAVYTLGLSDGTTVSHNVIHDVWSYGKYGWAGLGLYNDEGSTHVTLENNLVYHTKDMTYHQHYGRENVIRNNILVCGQDYQISVHRVEPHLSATFENNIVYWKTGKLFWQPSLDGRQLRFDNNVYWCASGEPFDPSTLLRASFMGLTFEEWQRAGHDAHSRIADPLFVDPDHLDFRLKPDSPALKLGFKEFDYTQAGVYGEAAWVALAQSLAYPPVQFAPDPPPPPPVEIDDDFENYPVGTAPLVDEIHVEGKGDAIAVTDETAAAGQQSLKVTDAAGLQYRFDPHLVYRPHYTSGLARCSFDLRVEEGVEWWHEWRDWSGDPYLIGPSLQVIGNRLQFRETDLLEVPVGQWFHLDLTAGLGPQSTGTFEVTVTLPGQAAQRFPDLPFVSPEWKQLTWIGFVSNAPEKTVFYLDNMRMDNPVP